MTVRRLAQAFVHLRQVKPGKAGAGSVVCWRVASSQAHPRSATFSLADYAGSVTPRIAGGNQAGGCSPRKHSQTCRPREWLAARNLTHADDRVQQDRILRVRRQSCCCPKHHQEVLSVSVGTDRPKGYKKGGWAAGAPLTRVHAS